MASSVRSWLLFIAASAANFAVMYNFNSIAMALLIMSESECTLDNGCKDGSQEKWVNSASNGVIFIGAVLGQLIFGYLGDKLGRGGGMAIVLIITTIAAVLSGLIPTGDPSDVYASVIAARLVLGLGVGGIYPLAATMATEINQAQREPSRSQSLINAGTYNAVSSSDKYANMGKNGKKEDLDVMACSWASFWQQPGIMGPWLVGYILTYTRVSTNWRWRLVLMIGGVPSFLALIALAIEYVSFPRRGPSLSEQLNDDQDEELKPKKATIGELFMSKETLWKLIGCGGSWFLFGKALLSTSLIYASMHLHAYNGDIC
jgi:PHS family inorganic phosphate transporter-like MFS transporter